MSTNGTLNGNGSHDPNGLLNGNGSLKESPSPSRLSKRRKLDWDRLIELIGPIATWTFLVVLASFGVWTLSHQAPKPPVSPRIQQIEKTIDNLYNAIDVLKDELPPDPDDNDHTSPYLR